MKLGRHRYSLAAAALLLLVGCEDKDGESPLAQIDSAVVDPSGKVDANVTVPADATSLDSASPDAGLGDGPSPDGATSDAAPLDTNVVDAQPADTAPKAEIALLEKELNAIVKTTGAELSSLAVLAIDDGKVSYEGHFGYSRIDNANPALNVKSDKDSLYRIASMSKMVMAIGTMVLVDSGKLDLDVDVSTYLGFQLRNPNFPSKVITTRMLLSHTSSIRDDGGYSFPASKTLASILVPGGANFTAAAWAAVNVASSRAPGDYFSYENLNFGILGSVVEVISGKRFDKFMCDEVLAPLGITGGFYPADLPGNVVSHIATLYRKKDSNDVWNPAGPWVVQQDDYSTNGPSPVVGLDTYVLGANGTLFAPQGSLRVTIADMGKIMQMVLDNGKLGNVRILKPSSVAALQGNEWTYNETAKNGNNYFGLFRSWGLGMQRFLDVNGGDRVVKGGGFKGFGHLGEAYGLLSGFIYDPATKDGLIYFIGGVGDDPENHFGDYSAFYKWEEETLTALYRRAVAHDVSP